MSPDILTKKNYDTNNRLKTQILSVDWQTFNTSTAAIEIVILNINIHIN